MYFIIYKTTNLINGKYYYGKHQTSNLDDGYLGSGKYLLNSVKKYGKVNFHRETRYLCRSRDIMDEMEEFLSIKEGWVADKKCYNLREGGEGGFDHIRNNPELEKHRIQRFRNTYTSRGDTSKYWSEAGRQRILTQAKLNRELGKCGTGTLGHRVSAEVRKKISLGQQGTKNSQYGTVVCVKENAIDKSQKKRFQLHQIPEGWISCKEWTNRKNSYHNSSKYKWINDGTQNKYHLKTESLPSGWKCGRLSLDKVK